MTKKELQKVIGQFDGENLKQQGIFGIYQSGGGSDESYIRANKEGLELFALELLKSARDTETTLADSVKKTIPFNCHENWIDETSDTFIQYIEPIAGKQKLQLKTETKTTIADRLMPYGCGLVGIVLVVSIIVGLIEIFKWLF